MKTLNINTILVPVDFSTMSIQAIHAASQIAQRGGARVHLVHVQDIIYPAGVELSMPLALPATNGFATIKNDYEQRLNRLRALATREHLRPGDCHVLIELPAYHAICHLARRLSADLIVMPTHGWTGLKHAFLGSTAERVVQHAPCPVLVTRGQLHEIKTILVPVDFSVSSLNALKEAIALAKRNSARIIVAHVIHLDLAFTADGYGMYNLDLLIERFRNAAANEMRAFLRRAKFANIKFKTRIEVGAPVTQICWIAENENVDVIVTATHGRTGLKHLLLGSVAEEIVRYAPRSILVIPSHPGERAKRISLIARKPRAVLRVPLKRIPADSQKFTKRFGKIERHAFPERRKTNKFRETHQRVSG